MRERERERGGGERVYRHSNYFMPSNFKVADEVFTVRSNFNISCEFCNSNTILLGVEVSKQRWTIKNI